MSVFVRSFVAVVALSALSGCSATLSEKVQPGAGSDGGTDGAPPTSLMNPLLTLPIEVLGDGSPASPVIAEADLALDAADVGQVAQLWFLCHRCGFYGAPEYEATVAPPTHVKASVRFVGGQDDAAAAVVPWIDITDDSVTLADDERVHGGLNGGFYSTRITMPLTADMRARLVPLPALNRVQFRFNGTDGDSNGFRIVSLQMQDAKANDLTRNTIVETDPLVEKLAGAAASTDVTAGQQLWYGRGILAKSALVTRKIDAACSSCHAVDGRDLQYFNYSNNAIIQRSRFHGLTAAQGGQIAAFLRHSLQSVPHVPTARPWNPPYQPGPNLDCPDAQCSPTVWAAGAGLGAVLHSSADAVKALFGKPLDAPLSVTQADVDQVMNANATMNVRQMPVAMQFPDWNAWLPTIHPFDVWPTSSDADSQGSFEVGEVFSGLGTGVHDPYPQYTALVAWLGQHQNPSGKVGDWSHLMPDERAQLMSMLTNAGWAGYNFLGGGRGGHVAAPNSGKYGAEVGAANLQRLMSTATTAAGPALVYTTNAFIERAVNSILHWNAVKQWEMAQQFGLEGNQQSFIGSEDTTQTPHTWTGRGELHGWPFNAPSLFYLAPHMTYEQDSDAAGNVTRQYYLAWEANDIVGSYYRTNQWYQLQMTINSGARSYWTNYPMDWPYLTGFDDLLGQTLGSPDPITADYQHTHYVRLLQGNIKSAQYVNNDITLYDPTQPNIAINAGLGGRGQAVKHLTTTNYLDFAYQSSDGQAGVAKSSFAFFDELQPGLFAMIINGSMQQFDGLFGQTDPAAWRRCDPTDTDLGGPEQLAGFRYCLDAKLSPLGQNSDGTYYVNDTNYAYTTEQEEQYGVWKAARVGADPARVATWAAWIKRMWP